MTDAANPICETPPDDTRTAERVAMLRELAQIGMRLAHTIERLAEDPETPDRAGLALAFSRVARAVRQTLALEGRLQEELRTGRAQAARAQAARRKTVVRHAVEAAIDAEPDDNEAAHLLASLYERLGDTDEAELLDRPVREIVASICKTLGISPDWTLWQDEPWAQEEGAGQASEPPLSAAKPTIRESRGHPGDGGKAHVETHRP